MTGRGHRRRLSAPHPSGLLETWNQGGAIVATPHPRAPHGAAARPRGRNAGVVASRVPTSACVLSQNLPAAQIPKPSQGQLPGKDDPGAGPCRMGRQEGEHHQREGGGGQTSHRYLNWLASEIFIAHLHICRLFHLSNSSDCFTLWE